MKSKICRKKILARARYIFWQGGNPFYDLAMAVVIGLSIGLALTVALIIITTTK